MALPQIVRAQVKKAKAGSLMHTRWLCSIAEKGLAAADAEKVKTSLAELLMEQLGHEL